MEVTRHNFNEKLDDIQSAIKQSNFIALDAEFTGLDTPQYGHCLPFDTPEERYNRLRKGSLDFTILQFGLCTFKYDNKKQRLIAQPFNFYIFPRPYSRQAPDKRFLCQSSSIDFLVSQGFDFNKVFYEGIPYLTPVQEQSLKDSIEHKHQLYSTQFSSPAFTSPHGQDLGPNKGPVAIPDDQKDFINGVVDKISSFLEKNEAEPLKISTSNGFQRKLIFQTVRSKFNSVHLEAKTENKKRYIIATKVTGEEDLKMREGAKQAAERAEIDDAVGFSKVIRMLSCSGKLLVGHNMLLDVLHTIDQFQYPLPEEYEDFKSLVKCIFPKLVDTKLMAQTHPFKDQIHCSVLSDLHKIISYTPFKIPKVEFPEGFKKYCEEGQNHEAGYDAYITGLCFAGMKNYLGNFQKPPKDYVSPSSPLIDPFTNKLFMMRNFEVPYMNLNGSDLSVNRDHVFHVTIPKHWKSTDITNLFTEYGNIQTFWLDDTSALVALYKKENAKIAYDGLSGSNSNYQIQRYTSFMVQNKKVDIEPSTNPGGKKRPMDDSTDNNAPVKKTKVLNAEAVPFISKQHDAVMEGDESSNSSTGSNNNNNNSSSSKLSYSTVLKQSTDKTTQDKTGKSEKMFEESSTW